MATDADDENTLQMFLDLNDSRDSIVAAAKWCRDRADRHEEIVSMWFFAVVVAQEPSQRLNLFHLASDILSSSRNPKTVRYYSSFLPQLHRAIPLIRYAETRNSMNKIFNCWLNKNIYNKVVMKEFNRLLKNDNKVVDMAIFKYDKDLLFKNLKRVEDLRLACNYIISRVTPLVPSIDNSQVLLRTFKQRNDGQSLLASLDSQKTRLASLVSFMEEKVHILKMNEPMLGMAANKEQNGVEETTVRILAYGEFKDKLRDVLRNLETTWDMKSEYECATIITAATSQPKDEPLYTRRVRMVVGEPGDPQIVSKALVVIPAVSAEVPPMLPADPVDTVMPHVAASWNGSQFLPPGKPEASFHRKDGAESMTARQEEELPPLPDHIPFTNLTPPPFFPKRRSFVDSPWRATASQKSEVPTFGKLQENLWREDHWKTKHDEQYDTLKQNAPRGEPCFSFSHPVRQLRDYTSRPQMSRDEPWERASGSAPTHNKPTRKIPPRNRGKGPSFQTGRYFRRPFRRYAPGHLKRSESFLGNPRRTKLGARPSLLPMPTGPLDNRHDTPRQQASRGEPYSSRHRPVRDEPPENSRPHTLREEPLEKTRGLYPTRNKPTRSSDGLLHTGPSSCGTEKNEPVEESFSNLHLGEPCPSKWSSRPPPKLFKTPFRESGERPAAQRSLRRPSSPVAPGEIAQKHSNPRWTHHDQN